MVKKIVAIGIALALLVCAYIALNTEPVVDTLMGFFAGMQDSEPSTSDMTENSEAEVLNRFVSDLDAASRYTFSGTLRISGDLESSPASMNFTCSVSGSNYAVATAQGGHSYRQLFVNGEYSLIDDTAQTVYQDVSYIAFPDNYFANAFEGRLTRIQEELFQGNPVYCFEMYNDGIVYALYFSKQGELIRCFYIFDSHEITVDFSGFAIGGTGVSFDVPATYTQRGSNDFQAA